MEIEPRPPGPLVDTERETAERLAMGDVKIRSFGVTDEPKCGWHGKE